MWHFLHDINKQKQKQMCVFTSFLSVTAVNTRIDQSLCIFYQVMGYSSLSVTNHSAVLSQQTRGIDPMLF